MPGVRVADDLVRRDFRPAAPDVFVGRRHHLPALVGGWLYLAAVQDAFSLAIVGWSMADHMRAELVVAALEMALHRRRPGPGLVHHSDQGSQYVSLAFGQKARDAGIAVSDAGRAK
jgi:putative transposase